jgi:hypothetical protein
MRDISDIILDGGTALERLLREAFDAGVEHGRNDAVALLKQQIVGFLANPQPTFLGSAAVPDTLDTETEEKQPRAAPGTVKPTIIRMITDGGLFGTTTEELIERTGFKPNSVRGTVSTLQSEGIITKHGDRWHTTEKILSESAAETNKGATGE